MKYYIITTTGFIRNKKETSQVWLIYHTLQGLFFYFFIFFLRLFRVPRKRLRGSAGEHSTFLPCMNIIPFILLICKLERQNIFNHMIWVWIYYFPTLTLSQSILKLIYIILCQRAKSANKYLPVFSHSDHSVKNRSDRFYSRPYINRCLLIFPAHVYALFITNILQSDARKSIFKKEKVWYNRIYEK